MLLLLACTASEPEPAAGPPDILLITLDTTRADRIGAYGDPLAQTPALDALASTGALFRSAWTPVPLTLPAHSSLFTGAWPHEHGLRDNAGYALDGGWVTVPERLRDAGYATGAFVSAYVLDRRGGLAQGFATYDDELHGERPAADTADRALAWWGAQDGPRMMWVHLFDAHRPYEPEGWTGDPYRGEIAAMDAVVSRLVESAGPAALVVVTADHGENLWDGQELEHGMVLTRSVLRVPLIVRPPGGLEGSEQPEPRSMPDRPDAWAPVPGIDDSVFDLAPVPDAPSAARVVDGAVSLLDVGATLLDYAGLEVPRGRSLRPAVEGATWSGEVYAETLYPWLHYGWAPSFFWSDGSTTWLDGHGYAPDDPWWQAPVYRPAPALIQRNAVPSAAPGDLSPEEQARLEQLGYVTGVQATASWEGAGPVRMDLLHRVFLAQGRMASEPADAKAELEACVTEDPGLVDAWFSLAQLRVNEFDREGAIAALDEVLRRVPDHRNSLSLKLVLLLALQRQEEALVHARAWASLRPDDQDCALDTVLARGLMAEDPAAASRHLERLDGCKVPDLARLKLEADVGVALAEGRCVLEPMERLYMQTRDKELLQAYRDCGGTGF